jgi:uncharacterized protein YegJ (DUF2314 family)
MESKDNIVMLCKDCSDQRRKDFQKTFDKYSLEVGDMIKANFKERKKSEHMWVEINSIAKDGVFGFLRNEPTIIKWVSEGDEVAVKFKDIEGHIKKEVHNIKEKEVKPK